MVLGLRGIQSGSEAFAGSGAGAGGTLIGTRPSGHPTSLLGENNRHFRGRSVHTLMGREFGYEAVPRGIAPLAKGLAMRSIVVALSFILLSTPAAQAASYLRSDGTLAPILLRFGSGSDPHPYAGADLGPGVDASSASLGTAVLTEADLSGANLSGASLDYAVLSNARLTNAQLVGTSLFQTEFGGADLRSADFSSTTLLLTQLQGADLSDAIFSGGILSETQLVGATARRLDLSGAFGREAYWTSVDFRGADMTGIHLEWAFLMNSDLTGATLRNGMMSCVVSCTSWDDATLRNADLSGITFAAGSLPFQLHSVTGTDFSGAVLANAMGLGNLDGIALYDASTDFTNAYADLAGATLFDPVLAGWTLVPEPSTALLLGLGLASLAARRR